VAANNIEEAVLTKLKATTNITNYVGSGSNARIYWIKAPAATATLPYITYETISRNNESEEFHYAYAQVRVQLSVWHNSKRNGQDLAENIVDLFHQYTGDIDGYDVLFGSVTGPMVLVDPDSDKLYQFVVDVNLNYRR
jgi:hypothetical protein